MSEEASGGCGCGGCVGLIITVLVLWAVFFGLPINDKKWNIDIFPPKIWDMNETKKEAVNAPLKEEDIIILEEEIKKSEDVPENVEYNEVK